MGKSRLRNWDLANSSRKYITAYFASRWLPSVVMLCVLLTFIIAIVICRRFPHSMLFDVLLIGLLILFILAIVGIPIAAIWNLIRRRWAQGVVNLLATLIVCIVMIPVVCFFLLVARFFGPSEDGFADELTIPSGVQVSEPIDDADRSIGDSEDTFQARILGALKQSSSPDTSVKAALPSFIQLNKDAPDMLRRYLATSPCWRVFKEKGSLFATRRWMIGSAWRYTLHGYYTRFDLGRSPRNSIPDFQIRLTLGLSGRPWARLTDESTNLQHGQVKPLIISGINQVLRSHSVVTCEDQVVEVFEQSGGSERRLTKAALEYLEEEFRPLAAAPTFSTIQDILPPAAIKTGQPTIELYNSFQPGIYNSEVWLNPGEPGMIYLKAYEVTNDTQLSAASLKKYSNEWIGWSDDSQQLFFSNTHFTIYEGDWGKPYAARFEVWFVPDSSGPERKLNEKIFKIEGWQR